MYLFGTTLLVAGVVMALLALSSYILVIRGNSAALVYGRAGIYGLCATVATAWLGLVALFVARRFDVAYVNNYSDSSLGAFMTVAASWAGQPGSFAFWALCTAIVGVLLVHFTRHFEPYVLAVVAAFTGILLVFTLVLNPFNPLLDPQTGLVLSPPDGNGLNPLLDNFWMIIHPPVLFVGYALALVPFGFALGALLRRDYDTWVVRALPWTLAAWSILGLALLLGGYWAYETLGWGGYWGWDPVENSSLVPWLLLTALLHGMLVQRNGGALRRTNILLALWSFIAVFYATFLTRSGVLSNFSVHSFVEEGIYGVMLISLLSLIVVSMGVFFWRMRDVPRKPLSDSFFSRDNFFALGILTLVIIATVIILGTSTPLISAIPGVGHSLQGMMGQVFELDDGTMFGGDPFEDGRFNVATSFYNITTPPLGLVALALLVLGPLLGWHDTNMRKLLLALRWPALATLVATCGALLLGVHELLPLSYVALSVFAGGVNLLMIVRTLRGGWLRIGGYLAHLGLTILLIGVVGSSAYATPDERLSFQAGETLTFQGYDITFNQWQETEEGGGMLDLTVQRGDESFAAQPELYFDPSMNSTIQNPSIHSYISHDLYIAPADYRPEFNPVEPIMGEGETHEMGPYSITFEGFNMDQEDMTGGGMVEVGATLLVDYQGEQHTVTPRLRVVEDPETGAPVLEETPVDLPGGETIALLNLEPSMRLIILQGAGPAFEQLQVQPERAVITVSTKPLVLLVWVGLIIGVLGGGIAALRRYNEGRVRLREQTAPMPRGGSGIGGRIGWRGGAARR
jgi:cytochrome c-type biogenesis protein CcmF